MVMYMFFQTTLSGENAKLRIYTTQRFCLVNIKHTYKSFIVLMYMLLKTYMTGLRARHSY